MKAERLTGRQTGALLLGTAAPLLLEASRRDPGGWALGLALALGLGALYYRGCRPEQTLPRLLQKTWGQKLGTVLTAGYLLWTLLLLAEAFCQSAECFPDTDAWPWIPAVLGTLAWLALRRGLGNLGRCAGVLWLPLGAIFLWLLLRAGQAGAWDRQELGGLKGWQSGAGALASALLAAAALPADRETRRALPWFGAALAVLAGAWAAVSRAVLGRSLQGELAEPFYELVRSVELFGGSAHLEALAAAAQETGFFLTLGLYGALGAELARELLPGTWDRAGAVLALGLMCSGWVRAGEEIFELAKWVAAGVFCVLIPLGTQAVAMIRKQGKIGKNKGKKSKNVLDKRKPAC